MEGVGSRLGRASSRYGPSTTAAVFNGPVRKWKKKWVHVSPSSTPASNQNSHFHSNGNSSTSRLLLCRWTPLSTATAAAADSPPDEPPRRKFRYTPIVVLDEQKKAAAKKMDHEATTTVVNNQQYPLLQTSMNDEQNLDAPSKTETQDLNTSSLDLGLCLKGHNSHNDTMKEDQTKKARSGGFWTTG